MNRQAQAAVLFLTGGAILHTGLTDLYLRYVKAGLRPLLLAAGVVLIATAAATVWYECRAVRTSTGNESEANGREANGREEKGPEEKGPEKNESGANGPGAKDFAESQPAESEPGKVEPGKVEPGRHGGQAHAHREPRISWLLVLPFLALILVAPPALGSYSAMRTGTALQKQPEGFATLPSGDPVRLSLLDYAGRAAYDHGRSLGNRRIKITGFLALDRGGTPYLVRVALSCCAADGQPVKVGLTGRTPPVLQPDSWIEVTGTYTSKRTRDPVNDGIIPFLDVTQVKPVPAPRDPYDESWNS